MNEEKDKELANSIWKKCKGKEVEKFEEPYMYITMIYKYWHRAMEKENPIDS